MKIEKIWEEYRKLCVPAGASEIQIYETRIAFYAGFMAMFEICNIIGRPGVSETHGIMLLEDLSKQIKQFRLHVAEAAQKRHDSN